MLKKSGSDDVTKYLNRIWMVVLLAFVLILTIIYFAFLGKKVHYQ